MREEKMIGSVVLLNEGMEFPWNNLKLTYDMLWYVVRNVFVKFVMKKQYKNAH